tara:strand:+ start:246 stop:1598 length:1353 start_codon:yes stop_codon:yes gene_type:complete
MLDKIFQPNQIRTNKEDLLKWGKDWTEIRPKPSAIVFPENEEQIIDLVNYAISDNKKIVPSGGRTGLSGGATAANGEIVLSFDRMNKIIDFNYSDKLVKCQSGVITADIQKLALEEGLYYPVDFSSSGSSQIGGNVATNAGGIRVIRYGLTRNWVSGLRLIDGMGRLMSLNNGLTKNASGYDLRHLVLGSEGTLGLITEVDMRLTKKPAEQNVILLGLNNSKNLLKCLERFSTNVELSAFEFFSLNCLEKVRLKHNIIEPFDNDYEYYALLEFDEENSSKIQDSFEHSLRDQIIEDGVISNSLDKANQLWKLRENISESISSFNPYKNDISLKISLVPNFLKEIELLINNLGNKLEICLFGHIGDGNIHLNILKPKEMKNKIFSELTKEISTLVYKKISMVKGSVSAEHGIGIIKKDFLKYTRTEDEIIIMRSIKNIFDPHQILNPGKLF